MSICIIDVRSFVVSLDFNGNVTLVLYHNVRFSRIDIRLIIEDVCILLFLMRIRLFADDLLHHLSSLANHVHHCHDNQHQDRSSTHGNSHQQGHAGLILIRGARAWRCDIVDNTRDLCNRGDVLLHGCCECSAVDVVVELGIEC